MNVDKETRVNEPTDPTQMTVEQAAPAGPAKIAIPIAVIAAVVAVLALGGLLVFRSESKTNKIALSASAKPVTVILAKAAIYRGARTYVGTVDAWVSASIGPQLVSAYVDTVLVRPGDVVKKNEVLATLDCRNSSAASQAVAASARALDARRKALSDESARYKGLLDGGFVAQNEVEQKASATTAQEAEVTAAQAKLLGTTLAVGDCVLRAPFDGEIATRTIDPGAFVRPGISLISLVDRSTVRLSADAPEIDFSVVAPGNEVKVHILATNQDLTAKISRRAPSADPTTRTVHFEIDLRDPKRQIPVGTTGEVRIDVGEPIPSIEVPLASASVRGAKATLFLVEGDVARLKTALVIGESGGLLFLDTSIANGGQVVSEGRALLQDGDKVRAKAPDEQALPIAPGVKK